MKRENYIMKLSTIELLPLGIFVVIRTKSPVGNIWDFCPRLLIESKYNFRNSSINTNRKKQMKKPITEFSKKPNQLKR